MQDVSFGEEQVRRLTRALQDGISAVLVGKEEAIRLLLAAFLTESHVLIEDMPGTGKTTLVKTLARLTGSSFARIQFTPDVQPSDITGVSFFRQETGRFEFRAGPVFHQILLADEINRASPRTQSALLECMEERQVTDSDGRTYPLPRPFLVLATENPIEQEGTFPLPQAQLDRFALKLQLGYPEPEEEALLLARFVNDDPLHRLAPVCDAEQVRAAQAAIQHTYISDPVRRYCVALLAGTREHPDLALGASPRAGLALLRLGQAMAAMQGRDFVLPDDIQQLAPYVLPHRLLARPWQERRVDEVVEEIVRETPVPSASRHSRPTA